MGPGDGRAGNFGAVNTPMQQKLDDLASRREEAYHAGSQRAIDRQHEKGKLLAGTHARKDGALDDQLIAARDEFAVTVSARRFCSFDQSIDLGWCEDVRVEDIVV
jgi:acetyl-CoA carboxylase carboxyltransferase component